MLDDIAGFDWDSGNIEKCQKHGVSVDEIEAVFDDSVIVSPDLAHSEIEQRLIAINRNAAGKPIFVAFTLREFESGTFVRPVSARYMHLKEAIRYEKSARIEN